MKLVYGVVVLRDGRAIQGCKMRKLLVGAAFAAMMAAAEQADAATNLVANGSFETGDFTGWTQFGDTSYTGVAYGCFDLGCPTDGSYLAYFGSVNGVGGISQALATGPGEYKVSFALSNDSGYFFSADLGSTNLTNFGTVGSFGTTLYSFTVAATGPETLSFGFYNPPAYYTLDNVSVTAVVPEPATRAMMVLGFAGLGFAGYRARRTAVAVSA
jgi:PEP-CTERM motif